MNFRNYSYARIYGCFVFTVVFAVCFGCGKLHAPPSARGEQLLPHSKTAININAASAKELSSLPHIGDTIANRIVEFRDVHGPFPRAEYLMLVQGISERRFREIRPLITVE